MNQFYTELSFRIADGEIKGDKHIPVCYYSDGTVEELLKQNIKCIYATCLASCPDKRKSLLATLKEMHSTLKDLEYIK